MTALATIQRLAPGFAPDIAVVLGSGWGGLTAQIQNPLRIPYAELAGFPQATVAGHSGELWLGHMGRHRVAVMSGRKHGYETGAVDGMKVPLQTFHALGCSVLVQTNAAGSVRAGIPPQSLMLITDHLNLPQRSPLVGEAGSERFVGMVDAYDPGLRQQALLIAAQHGQPLHQGVYAWFFGPQFETPAEIRMAQLLGADAVGMSTVPETILARHLGLRVLALSLITNMGAGLSQEQLSHAHTLEQAQAASDRASSLLAHVVAGLQLENTP
ncbi:purine-nucleoside phosphorylase [Curvibacter sp. APW13]|uniref:purine-nucleoside phosphorylase n=1 Tax=Curvibacter sp. APW13 TaxID=3077236 RepID=UPI0028DE0EBF|nr:purine-nucleoside phosphorylase [Curvibacter sp. APW13]MDT8992315.1 purine-nucleoside phosphorylase [Curvibacter sp. APW13]